MTPHPAKFGNIANNSEAIPRQLSGTIIIPHMEEKEGMMECETTHHSNRGVYELSFADSGPLRNCSLKEDHPGVTRKASLTSSASVASLADDDDGSISTADCEQAIKRLVAAPACRSLEQPPHSLGSFRSIRSLQSHLPIEHTTSQHDYSDETLEIESLEGSLPLIEDDASSLGHDGRIREEYRNLAKNSTVSRFKIATLLMLLCATVLVTFFVWHFVKLEQEDEFEQSFETYSNKVTDAFVHAVDMKIWTAYTLSSVYSSRFGLYSNEARHEQIWPNVTMPNYYSQIKGATTLAHASSIFFAPILTNETVKPWLKYAEQIHNANWSDHNGLHHIDGMDKYEIQIRNESGIFNEKDYARPKYAPLWQVSHHTGDGVFFLDLYSYPTVSRSIDAVEEHKDQQFSSFALDYRNASDTSEPNLALLSPIFSEQSTRDKLVGIIGLEYSLSEALRHIVPPGVSALHVTIECKDKYIVTFEVVGEECAFIGIGDFHDDNFDDMEHETKCTMINTTREYTDHLTKSRIEHEMQGENTMHRTIANDHPTLSDHHSMEAEGDDYEYIIRVYPTKAFRSDYINMRPMAAACIAALIFIFTSMTFIIYDCLVERRSKAIVNRAIQSSKIVHSLFPATVRERLFEQATTLDTPAARIKNFLNKSEAPVVASGEPIADMFPETTIIFADIAGFTAWSSEREPQQVFVFLEAIYREFDAEAKKHGIFKIETIGDCYVAATGIPDRQDDHAVVMARFAQQCLVSFQELTTELELSLGPGTTALGLRIGIHSGAVTAGVLRGEKSRFQLFGDTMNTASRMESSGKKNLIHLSPETAKLIQDANKSHWLVPREDIVVAKGKGEIQTYWLRPKLIRRPPMQTPTELTGSGRTLVSIATSSRSLTSVGYVNTGWDTESDTCDRENIARKNFRRKVSYVLQTRNSIHSHEDNLKRMVKWNVAVLENLLVKVVAHRQASKKGQGPRYLFFKKPCANNVDIPSLSGGSSSISHSVPAEGDSKTSLMDEMNSEVKFATYDPRRARVSRASKVTTSIGKAAQDELTNYVSRVASMYRRVHFHNFEHASHVTMSANKLMKKICAAYGNGTERFKKDKQGEVQSFFQTFGICFDPLAQFAVLFSALVHDVDHYGVPNVQVIKEKPAFAAKYQNTSVAEQNSITVAWNMLMEPEFSNLRACIWSNDLEKHRFKQLLIHMIIATDIADRVRMQKEKKRWNIAFCDIESWEKEWREKDGDELANLDVSFRATAVLEQLMLASDISHTMQHWITYVKWNERLFKEQMTAYIEGRAEQDPREGWYESELGFFDFYIIPLAQRLKDCGVFGSAGDEYLGYALKNRQEWTEKGHEIAEKYNAWGDSELNKVLRKI